MSETRPLLSGDERSEASTWDVASLAQVLNTTPHEIDDSEVTLLLIPHAETSDLALRQITSLDGAGDEEAYQR